MKWLMSKVPGVWQDVQTCNTVACWRSLINNRQSNTSWNSSLSLTSLLLILSNCRHCERSSVSTSSAPSATCYNNRDFVFSKKPNWLFRSLNRLKRSVVSLMPQQVGSKMVIVCCDRLLLTHSANFSKLMFMVIIIFSVRRFCAPSSATPGGNRGATAPSPLVTPLSKTCSYVMSVIFVRY